MAERRPYSTDRLIKKSGGNKEVALMSDVSGKVIGLIPTVMAVGIMERTTRLITKRKY